jgi:hypothetical protein
MAARPLFNHPPGRSCCRATCYVPHGVSKWMDAIHTGSQVVISCEQCTTHTTLHTHTTPVATAVRTAAPRGRAMRRTSPARSAVRSSAPRRRRGRPRPPPARRTAGGAPRPRRRRRRGRRRLDRAGRRRGRRWCPCWSAAAACAATTWTAWTRRCPPCPRCTAVVAAARLAPQSDDRG